MRMGILGPPPRNESKDSLEKALDVTRAYAGSDNCDPKVLPELLGKLFHAVQELKYEIGRAEKTASGSEREK